MRRTNLSLRTSDRESPPDVLLDARASQRGVQRALVFGALFIGVSLVITFAGFEWRSESLLREQQLLQARAFTEEIVATRQFVAMHGGVYVPDSVETTLNPFLARIPGLRTSIVDRQGRRYVLQNPAVVTQSVGRILAGRPGGRVEFRLSSDKPIDPANRARGFEAEAIRRFESEKLSEYYARRRSGGDEYFMYARSLPVELRCLQCHASQGYRTGQVRGAISVRIPTSSLDAEIRHTRWLVALALVGALGTLLLVLYLISRHLLHNLLDAEDRLRTLATLDALTGIENRRMGMRRLADELARADRNGTPLAAVMFDLDNFKRVNDTFGHSAGDEVLAAAARGLAREARPYDAVSRIGGEEFLVLLPDVSADNALAAGERLRASVAVVTAEVLDGGVTVSGGIALYRPGSGESPDALLRRTDDALYEAKRAGRDRLRLAEE